MEKNLGKQRQLAMKKEEYLRKIRDLGSLPSEAFGKYQSTSVKKLYDIDAVHVNTLIRFVPHSHVTALSYSPAALMARRRHSSSSRLTPMPSRLPTRFVNYSSNFQIIIYSPSDWHHLSGHGGHTGNESVSQYGC